MGVPAEFLVSTSGQMLVPARCDTAGDLITEAG